MRNLIQPVLIIAIIEKVKDEKDHKQWDNWDKNDNELVFINDCDLFYEYVV